MIEEFCLPTRLGDSFKWTYTQDEYLDKISHAKFGLCLAGFGPKCNREIEYFGLGIVPIMAPQVDTVYYNKLEEGVHYLRVDRAEEVPDLIKSTSKEKWKEMSEEGRR